jgi:DNA-binding GntR family transcriptional regulator
MIQRNLTDRVNAIQSTAEVIASSLKEMIYEAELKPGQQLVQEAIARMFQVSRVPVRDALQILIKTGIAVNVPRRGVIVRPLSRKALLELFEVRRILEGSAIRMVVKRMTLDRLTTLNGLMKEQLECLKTRDVKRQEKLDDAFHRTLYEAVENATLLELIFSNWERIKQARCSSTVLPEQGQRWIGESIKRHNIESSRSEITSCIEKMEWVEPEESVPSDR